LPKRLMYRNSKKISHGRGNKMTDEDATIASLKIVVDSTQLDEAIKKLDYIVAAVEKIEKSICKFNADGMPECRPSQNKSPSM